MELSLRTSIENLLEERSARKHRLVERFMYGMGNKVRLSTPLR